MGLVVAASQTRLVDPIALFIFDHYLRFRLDLKLPKQEKNYVPEDPPLSRLSVQADNSPVNNIH